MAAARRQAEQRRTSSRESLRASLARNTCRRVRGRWIMRRPRRKSLGALSSSLLRRPTMLYAARSAEHGHGEGTVPRRSAASAAAGANVMSDGITRALLGSDGLWRCRGAPHCGTEPPGRRVFSRAASVRIKPMGTQSEGHHSSPHSQHQLHHLLSTHSPDTASRASPAMPPKVHLPPARAADAPPALQPCAAPSAAPASQPGWA